MVNNLTALAEFARLEHSCGVPPTSPPHWLLKWLLHFNSETSLARYEQRTCSEINICFIL